MPTDHKQTNVTPLKHATAVSKRVLIIDDDESIRRLMERQLRAEGFEVFTAATPDDVLDWFNTNGVPDLLLSDIRMPVMSGTQLYGRLKSLHGDFPVLFVSGYPGNNDAHDKPLLQKPFSRADLIAAIKNAL